MKYFAFGLAAAAATLSPLPAAAKVAQVAANGFVIRHLAEVSASVEETWAVLLKPSVWWDGTHTWSGDAANLTLDARAGGCFCEILPATASSKAGSRGSVEHMRVVYVERPRALRMVGALGPLQADAATATLTIQLKANPKGGTQILLEYVVGGYTRTPFDKLAPAVDSMLAGQVGSLAAKLGGTFSAAFPAPDMAPAPPAAASGPPVEAGTAEAPGPDETPGPVEGRAPDEGIVPLSDAPVSSNGTVVGR